MTKTLIEAATELSEILGNHFGKSLNEQFAINNLRTAIANANSISNHGLVRYGWSEAYIGDSSELVEDSEGTYVKYNDVVNVLDEARKELDNMSKELEFEQKMRHTVEDALIKLSAANAKTDHRCQL